MSNNNNNNSNKRLKIINEEKYVDSLNKIIQRDFFPDLPNLKNQLEWLDAVESNDMDRMKSVQLASLRRATTGRRNFNGETPMINNSFETPNNNSFETPIIHNNSSNNNNNSSSNNNNDNNNNNNNIENTNLDSFVNTYTSEDDASYIGIQEKQNERILIKYKWLFDKANEYNKKNQQQRLEGSVNSNTTTATSTSTNSMIEYNTPKCIIPNTGDYKVKNHLMFKPSTLDRSLLNKQEIIGGPPKEIQYNNTRITGKIWSDQDSNPALRMMNNSSSSSSNEKPFSEMTLSEQIEKLKQMELEGKSTMEIESSMLGYLSTPQIIPGRGGDESPLMTWGRVDGTPLLLNSQPISTPLDLKYKGSTSFKIPETPKREQLANKLYEKVTVSKSISLNSPKRRPTTGRGGGGGTTPTLQSLSPAAQRLIQQKNGGQTPINIKSPHHIDNQLRKSYSSPTPKPKHFSSSNLTPTPKSFNNNSTPKLINTPSNKTTTTNQTTNQTITTTTTTTSSITDNLLNF